MRSPALPLLCALLLAACGEQTVHRPVAEFTDQVPLPAWDDGTRKSPSGNALEPNTLEQDLRYSRPPSGPVVTPAEWEPNIGVIINVPLYDDLMGFYGELIEGIVEGDARPILLVESAAAANAVEDYLLIPNGVSRDDVDFFYTRLDSFWTRDYGPWFVGVDGRREIVDLLYYGGRPNDDYVPVEMGEQWNMDVYSAQLYMEGGNFMTDGRGTCWVTEGVLWNNSRSRASVTQLFRDYAGCRTTTFVPPIPDEPTTHIDMFAKVLDRNTILVSESSEALGASYDERATLDEAARILRDSPHPDGRPWNIVRVPMSFGYEHDGWEYSRVYYTHTNSLIVNERVLIPTYGRGTDSQAYAAYRAAMPGYEIVGVDSSDVIPLGGSVHCTTMQMPAGAGSPPPASTTTQPAPEPVVEPERVTVTHEDRVGAGEWHRYKSIQAGAGPFVVTLTPDADADLYVRRGDAPTSEAYDCRPYSGGDSPETCQLTGPGEFFVSINGYEAADYVLELSYAE